MFIARVSTKTDWSEISKYFFGAFPRNSVPSQQKNSELFQYLQLTKFEKFQFLAQIATKMTKIPDLFAEFPHFFSTTGPPLKNQYYFRTFWKYRSCTHPAVMTDERESLWPAGFCKICWGWTNCSQSSEVESECWLPKVTLIPRGKQ